MSNNVFVGNIPYDYTEEQLVEIFKQVGPVKNFRLVFDKDNGRGKGYGFCEFLDPSSAQSAVRNLDGYDVGNRQLRVAFSDSEQNKGKASTPAPSLPPTSQAPPAIPPPQLAQHLRMGSVPPVTGDGRLPPLPVGTLPQPGVSATDAISKTLQVFPPMQLLEIISQFKTLVHSNPEQAENLLKQSPPLSYAVLQALLLMNLVDAQVLTKVISQGQTPAVPPVAAVNPSLQPPQQYRNSPTPQPQQYRQPTPQFQQRQPTPQRDPSTAHLIAQVMALTEAQISALPLEQKTQIMQIKQNVAAGLM